MSLENLHKATAKADLNQVKFLLESNNVKKGSFRLALQNSIKDKKNRDIDINKEIFSLILDYNLKHNIVSNMELFNAFKDAMASKDSFFITNLLKNYNLHQIVSNGFKLDQKKSIDNLITLFYMAGRFNKTENVKILIQHNEIENICGDFKSDSYQNFILSCLNKFIKYGNSPSYLYFWNDFLINKDKISFLEHIKLSIKNNFQKVTILLIDYSNFEYKDILIYIQLCFSEGRLNTCKQLIEKHKTQLKSDDKFFNKIFNNVYEYPPINKKFINFIKFLESESIFYINDIAKIIYNSNYTYLKSFFKKEYTQNKIKDF
tara:strand:+ start:804 stop:1757 length:954 start_codon:yes stop_codon:yes gene_type:complete